MQNYEIKIDKDGLWYYNGAHMFRKDIVNLLFQHLRQDEHGRYLIEMGLDCCYLDVEDTAYIVIAVYKTRHPQTGREQIEILLNDDSCEILNLDTLRVGKENVLYCRVQGNTFDARVSTNAYYQMADFLEHEEGKNGFYVKLNEDQYNIYYDPASQINGGSNA